MKQRTTQQNKALYKGCELLAEALNNAGFEMKAVLQVKSIDVPWNKDTVKAVLYNPIMEAMTGKKSTTELDRMEISAVWDVLNRHSGENFGVTVPFPSEDEY